MLDISGYTFQIDLKADFKKFQEEYIYMPTARDTKKK